MKRLIYLFLTFLVLLSSCEMQSDTDSESDKNVPDTKKGQLEVSMNDQVITYNQEAYKFTDIYNDPKDEDEYGTLTFTIRNIGDGTLNLTGTPVVRVERATAAFSVMTQPSRTSLAPNVSTTFTIKFKPTNKGEVIGEFIILNDGEEYGDFYFYVTGKGLTPKPIIKLADEEGKEIGLDSSYTAKSVKIFESNTTLFKIKNLGREKLSLTGDPKVQLAGTNASSFEVVKQPADVISSGSSSIFEIKFNAGEQYGEKTAMVMIESDDKDIPVYSFIIKATALDASAQISIKKDNEEIAPSTGSFDYNNIFDRMIIGKSYTTDFTVKNAGSLNLTFDSAKSVSITGENADCFSVVQYPQESVTPDKQTTFSIAFTPNSTQNVSAIVTVYSNSRDNSEYSFVVQGTGTAGNTDATLSDLIINEGILVPDFSPVVTEYQLNIDSSVTSCNFTPICNDENYTSVCVDGTTVKSEVALNKNITSTDKVEFVVTAEDGVTSKTYTININGIENFSNADLSDLFLCPETDTTQQFDVLKAMQTTSSPVYKVRPDVAAVKVLATAKGSDASVYVNGTKIESGSLSDSIVLSEDDTKITVKVVSQDGKKTKNITVTCCYYDYAQISIEKDSAKITPTTGSVDYNDDFTRLVIGKTYTIDFTLKNSGDINLLFDLTESISISGENAGCFSVVTYPQEKVTPNDDATFSLAFTPTSTQTVTATVTVYSNSRRNSEYSFIVEGTGIAGNTDATLSNLFINEGILVPDFSPSVSEYQLNIDSSITSCGFTPSCNDKNYTSLFIDGVAVKSGNILNKNTSSTDKVEVVVVAEDGVTSKTYTININNIDSFSSADLSGLILCWDTDTTQQFDVLEALEKSDSPIYYLRPDIAGIKVLATPLNGNASVYVNGTMIANGTYSDSIALSRDEDTEISVRVVSQDNASEKSFTTTCRYYGAVWEKVGTMPVSAANHQVVYHNNKFCMTAYTSDYSNYGYWTSPNGDSWSNHGAFDEESNIWSELGASTILNNTIYTVGGFAYNDSIGDYEISATVLISTNGTVYSGGFATSGLTDGIIDSALVAFNNKLYLLGGETKSGSGNTIWTSTDGLNWTKGTTPTWGARAGHAATVYNNKIYIAGGAYNDGNSERRDVWSLSDGTTWTQNTSSAAWTGRNDFTLSATSYGIFLVAGNDGTFCNDVWFSHDGTNWICVTEAAAFSGRAAHQACIKDGYIYIFGGATDWDDVSYDKDDVWRTYVGE